MIFKYQALKTTMTELSRLLRLHKKRIRSQNFQAKNKHLINVQIFHQIWFTLALETSPNRSKNM